MMGGAQWHRTASAMTGGGWMMSRDRSGWSTPAVVGVVILALVGGGLVVVAVTRFPRRGGSHGPTVTG